MKYGFLQPEHAVFPPIVHVETTNICNLRCIHCPHADVTARAPGYRPEQMPLATWKRVVDEVAEHDAVLRLTPDGEPLLLNDFPAQIAYAQERKIHTVAFNTNGVFLEKDKAEALLRPSSTRIAVEVSLDALFRETYERIRVGSDFRRVWRNVMDFIHRRDCQHLENVKVMVSLVQQPEVPDVELELFQKFWSQVADRVIMRNYVDTKGLTPGKMVGERSVTDRWPCPVVFTRLVVTWDGGVRFCPDDWPKSTTLSTLDRSGGLEAIWRSEEFQALRQSHLAGEFTHPTCAACTDWKVIRWGLDYTVALARLFGGQSAREEDSREYLWRADRDGGRMATA